MGASAWSGSVTEPMEPLISYSSERLSLSVSKPSFCSKEKT